MNNTPILLSGAVFIADSHYNQNRQEVFEFLQHTTASQIIFMGDIFDFISSKIDFWKNKNKKLVDLINELAKTKQIIFIEGNHDFALDGLFHKDILIVPREQQPLIAAVGDKKVALAHGDIFSPIGYNIYCSIIRNKSFLKFLNSINFKDFITLIIDNWLLEKSICSTIKEFDSFAQRRIDLYSKYEVDLIVEGHYHQGKSYKNYFNIPSYACSNKMYGVINSDLSSIEFKSYN